MQRALLRLEKDGTDRQIHGRTDGQTPDRYTTLTARRGQCNKEDGNEADDYYEDLPQEQ